MIFIDTNIFIRFLTDDVPEKADACEKIFRQAVEKKESLFTTEMVVAEIIWVLESYYNLEKDDIADKIEKILNTPNLVCPNSDLILNALNLYVEKNIDYIDAYNSLILKNKQIESLYSYDKHFDRLNWLKRMEP